MGLLRGRFREAGPRGLPGEVVQVDGFDWVEPQHPREGVEHLLRGGVRVPLLQARVLTRSPG
ncbi:hypothetical protein Nocox_10850 [Nonomuraea coxensis DSM 45129]|uniref:Uncharacterized protein n=1 Tax=Nonomuraea coxensis DSM 45129 TaxID=1122611 RepID=A0ABX8TXX5_9ACTN|nr:hypothetical protein [Nonomuraea coxensis]QYC39789.1 hypothetical protein Nocox_10850 [Nonomuraea coxensis DSM 45129]